jgi:hypothetical protein
MSTKPAQPAAAERVVSPMNGWMMLIVNAALLFGAAFVAYRG